MFRMTVRLSVTRVLAVGSIIVASLTCNPVWGSATDLVETIAIAFASDDPETRLAGLAAMDEEIFAYWLDHYEETWTLVASLMEDPDPAVRGAAAHGFYKAIMLNKGPVFYGASEMQATHAPSNLVKLDSHLEDVTAYLSDPDAGVRETLFYALANWPGLSVDAFAPIAAVLEIETDESVLKPAALALAAIRPRDALVVGELVLRCADDRTDYAAVTALGQMFRRPSLEGPVPEPPQEVLDALRAELSDPESSHRIRAAQALGDIGIADEETKAALRDLIASSSIGEVRAQASSALGRIERFEKHPEIVTHPASINAVVGSTGLLSCSASGGEPLTYHWVKDGVALEDGPSGTGATLQGTATATLTIQSVQSEDAGEYVCGVSNEWGIITSNPALVRVGSAPSITAGPAAASVATGSSFTLACTATGTGPLAFTWTKDDAALSDTATLSGTASPSLQFAAVAADHSGSYRCHVSNDWGSAESVPAQLTVGDPPAIAGEPASVESAIGANATFSCSASGTEPLAYQWLRNGVELVDGARVTGSATPSVTVSSLVASDAGGYACRVANGFGEAVSASASLVIGNPPQVTSQPAPATAIAGGEASFSCAATGDGTLSYQWQKDGADLADDASIEGAATAQVTIRNVDASSAGTYRCLASSDYGQALSDPAALDFESWRAYPVETLSSNWISSEPVHDQLDDPTTVVTSRMTAGTSLSDALTVRMAPMSDPDTDLGHEIHVRARALDNAPVTLRVHLMRGSTSLTYQNLEFGFEESVAVVAIPPEAATNLEDYGDVQIKVVKFHEISGNNSDRRAELVEVEFRVPEVSAPVQRVAAVGTTATNSFSPTPVHEQVDDLTNVVTSSVSAGTSDSFTLAMASMTDPGTDEGHVLRVRGRALDNEPVRIRIMLLQGGTTLKYWGRDLDFEESTVRVAIPASVASGLTDYSDVRVRIVKFNELWNESNRRAEINWIELEAPLP